MIYNGVIVPMITPLREDLSIDKGSVEKILSSFLQVGVSPFLLGTTGESTSLSFQQKEALVRKTVEYIKGRLPVYAGISGNCLEESTTQAILFDQIGVDAVVAHPPFYYPMSESQMEKYFLTLADAVPCPLILYNNPMAMKNSIPVELADKLSRHENIVGLKDSERDVNRLDQSIGLWKDRDDFAFLVGWAAQSVYALQKGAHGIVPSTANLTPKLYRDLFDLATRNKAREAETLQQVTNRLSEIYQKNKNLSQSIPSLKKLMSVYGLCQPYVMPPMYRLDPEEEESLERKVREALRNKTQAV